MYGLSDVGVRRYGGKTFDDHSARTLDHELEITRFHIELSELCAANGISLQWHQADLKHGVNPDAYFSLTRDGKTNHFFLEVERAKIGNFKNGEPSIIRKLRHYYEYYNTPECEKQWGFKMFRVILVMPTAEKCSNLIGAMQNDLRHRMFWLGTGVNAFRSPKDDMFSFTQL